MTVEELIELLKLEDPKSLVVLSKDSEGNGYYICNNVSNEYKYRDGEVGLKKLTDEYIKKGYSSDDVMKGGKPAIILWP